MSRTGVGCRVMIDGLQLDDGCIDWGAGTWVDPWTEQRRNQAHNPRAVAAGGGYVGTGGEVVTFVPGWDGFESAARVTIATSSACANRVLIDGYQPNTTYRIRGKYRPGRNSGSSYVEIRYSVITAPANPPSKVVLPAVVANTPIDFDVTVTSHPTQAGTVNAGFVIVQPGGAGGLPFDVTGVIVEVVGTDTGGYFDGSTISPDEALRYRWTGTANASPSVQELGTFQVPGGRLPQGVSAAGGLTIAWGRDTTVDQPQASTCTFLAVDDPGGTTVLQTFRLGARVDVFADATITGGSAPAQPAFEDPSFDTEVRSASSNDTVTRSQQRTQAGGWAAKFTRPDGNRQGTVQLPPGPLQTAGTNPLAWVQLATTRPGDTWTIAAQVWVPSGIQVRMRPVLYAGPYSTAATTVGDGVTLYGSDDWLTAEVTFSPGTSSRWVGFQFDTTGGITWGEAQGTWGAAVGSWGDLEAVFVDAVTVTNPGGGNEISELVFSGRITDMEGVFDQGWQSPALSITATDFLGDLGNRYIGDEPWPKESVTQRVARIVAQAKLQTEALQVQIAPTVAGIAMAPDDVDHAAAAGLLTDVAQSVDGVLWSATHPVIGPYLRIEDPGQRMPLYQLQLVGGLIEIVPATFTGDDAPPAVSSCDVLRDPVTFTTDVSDIATRATVSWEEAGTDDEGQPTSTERTYEVIDAPAESESGTRSIHLSTQLTSEPDAARVADQLIARLAASWRITGLAVDDATVTTPDATAARMLLTLLDGVTRGGQPLVLTDLPEWSPVGTTAPIYLEGGTYTFTGGWALDLSVSRAAGIGRNVSWDELPNSTAWTWDSWDSAITWDDLRGVAAPNAAATLPTP